MKFEITPEQDHKIYEWLFNTVYPPIIEQQKLDGVNDYGCHEDGYPYQGAIGGGLTYSFTPTSIGTIFKVRAYDQELDLTEYDLW